MSKRDLFKELTASLIEAKAHSEGKLALKSTKLSDQLEKQGSKKLQAKKK